MNQSSQRKLVISFIVVFVFILAVLLIVFVAYSSIEDNSEENKDINNAGISDKEQMKIDCINLGCPAESQSIYVGSKNSDKYHECSCGYAKNILPENIICFANDEDAISDRREKGEC